VQKGNFEELSSFPLLAAKLGFRRITFSLDLHYFGKGSMKEGNEALNMSGALTEDSAKMLVALGEGLGVDVSFWIISSKYSSKNVERLCPWPFERLYVSSDMRIVPCSIIATPEVADLGDAGNLNGEWNSGQYQ